MNSRLFTFAAGSAGLWSVVKAQAVAGESLAQTEKLDVIQDSVSAMPAGNLWSLRGVTSNTRYVTSAEKWQLISKQVDVGSAAATHAALIPIRKNSAWWELAQDERRKILEETSGHIRTGMHYLPAIARRLHHCRDLGENQPFDFLTWFDYAPAAAQAFEDLVGALRATEEWRYVEREVDIRLVR